MKKILGVVLELNPPHNGHQYFIDEAKRKVNPDITVAVISTNFSMRGDISVIDKFTKTNIALEMGIDIILELPFLSAINSADYFCFNAIKTLVDFGITDLAFGVELDNLDKLLQIKNLIKSDIYQTNLKYFLDKGLSYSSGNFKAIQNLIDDDDIKANFTLPNNTLGIQYLTALEKLNSSIKVTLIKRIQNNYYDEVATSNIASATSIRNIISENKDPSYFMPKFETNINFIDQKQAYNNLFMLIKFQLLTKSKEELQEVFNVTEGIENRLINMINISNDYFEFVSNIQTRRYTINKIKRLLLHILANTSNCYEVSSYLRILGFNDKGRKHVSSLNKLIKNMIITSFKNNFDNLVLSELNATKIYGLITNNDKLYLEEFKIPIKQGEI